MVSNQERRHIAAMMREAAAAKGKRSGSLEKMLSELLGIQKQDSDAWGNPVLCAATWRDVYRRLAELIDRPLCDALFYYEDEERTWEDAEPSDEEGANFCQCGNCGERLHWMWGEKLPHYCHNCGAEVER